ncbi:conserved hypothetical protein [Solidesulfovibrio fructosivorans JJ]]|uniref:Lipoprotein n=1 Tax=Solidesulfovibrio fructosivorans JJ] TaxID=596151 RepID=E1JVI4_SOLFR|nr:hypothetical protein [Solidesulfovibrio fructosivorans]EFL51778.1 conserved hypothetical protein [Solidesulfovibrio fructosivorans JJ]]
MQRVVLVAAMVLLLAGCGGAASKMELAGEPTVYARVLKAPDPLLMGCYLRSRPSEYHRPNSYQYCLVKKGDKYAVYYDWRDGKTLEEHKGWMPFTINGDRLVSDTEPSTYLVKDGSVWHNYGGRTVLHKMIRQ